MIQRWVVITGAARGIGLATTDLMRAAGWGVMMVDRDAPELAQAVQGRDGVVSHVCDISDPQAVASLADAAGRLGPIGALVNNAGVADFRPLAETDFETWRRVMATNLDGTFLVSQALTEALVAARGAVVNIASISGLRASTLRVAYGTSKAAVIQLTLQQAAELGERGVRANCVCPGPVRTKLAMAVHSPEIIKAYHDAIPLNRYGSETEIGEAIAWLCSDKATYVNGQVLSVDGGFESTGIGLPALRH